MRRKSNQRKGTGRKVYAILVDGETEKWYLDKLRAHENPMGITIKPDLPRKTALQEQFETVKKNADVYDVSVWIVDLDVILNEGKEAIFNGFLSEIEHTESLRNRVYILVNAPSLEFWFLQHVKDTGKFYLDCASVITDLKKYTPLKEYSKSEKYFINGNPDIYKRLQPYLSDALDFASKRGDYKPESPKRGVAEMYKLFAILGIAVDGK